MRLKTKKQISVLLALAFSLSPVQPSLAASVTYMPGVTSEMSDASYWSGFRNDAQDVILTPEEIEAFNQDTALASGIMVMDLESANETFDGKARNELVKSSSTADAEYYFGWTYGPDGKKATGPTIRG